MRKRSPLFGVIAKLPCLCLPLLLLQLLVKTASAQDTPCWTFPEFEAYAEDFAAHWQGNTPPEPLSFGEYVRPETYDHLYRNSAAVFVARIEESQNQQAGMAWGTSYHMQSLNDMFRATGELKYLEMNLTLARASMAATDEALGRETFFGEISPAWGSSQYREDGGYTVHLAHTGMIAWPILEFLHLSKSHQDDIELGDVERGQMLENLTRALDFHQRSWRETHDDSGSSWYFRDEYISPSLDQKIVPFNMMSALANALYWSWRITDNSEHYDRLVEVARYIKHRLPIYVCTDIGVEAYFWNYFLDLSPVNNPRQWTQLPSLNGGEDFSHAALSVTFPILMAREGIVFSQEDLERFRNTVLYGFGRNSEGILAGNVVGDYTRHGPNRVVVVGYWLALADTHPSVYHRLLPFFLGYQARPRNLDIGKLLLHSPANTITVY